MQDIQNTIELFEGIDAADIDLMLDCVDAKTKKFRKGSILLLAGEKPRDIGVLITGELHITRDDRDGNRSLIAVVTPGQIYAEALCCADIQESPVTVTAGAASSVMTLNFSRLLRTCPNSCAFHARLIRNMLELIAKKNLFLQSRLEILSMKTIRAKVLRYLESFMMKQGNEIAIPLNREQMAEYLSVERSALSHELARMKKEGLLEYRKNRFKLSQ